MICLQTPSFGWSFQDGRQLASKPAHHKQRVCSIQSYFSDQRLQWDIACVNYHYVIYIIAVIFTAISLKSFFVRVNFYIFNCFFLGENGNRRSKFVFMWGFNGSSFCSYFTKIIASNCFKIRACSNHRRSIGDLVKTSQVSNQKSQQKSLV